VYDRATKTAKDLLPKFDNWVDEFVWAPNSKMIFFTSADEGESTVSLANLDGTITSWANHGNFGDIHPLLDGKSIVASLMTVSAPGEVVAVTRNSDSPEPNGEATVSGEPGSAKAPGKVSATAVKPLTRLNSDLLNELSLTGMESFWFNAKDGTKVQGFIVRPPNFDAAKKYPLKFLIHGGPESDWGDAWSYRWNAELFAANGYVVIMINPRGSTGYGQAFTEAIIGY